jgi:predicted nucleotidyltransferase
MSASEPNEEIFDLEAAVKTLCGDFPEIVRVYLFGSRRFNTRSSRSDIDILLECKSPIRKSALREFILKHRSALDLFIMESGRAESVANDSFITSSNNDALIGDLHAVELYARGTGSSSFLRENKQAVLDRRVMHKLTTLPGTSTEHYEVGALLKYFQRVREHGLPVRPFLGYTTDEASEFIAGVIRGMPSANRSVTGHGSARDGWTFAIENEADFQNLFWITVKPWLPGLSREEVAITYDGKEKKSDFSIFGSQLIIEFKHIKDAGDARETAKTLEGLSSFYSKHANVRTLLFAILVDVAVDMDDRKWEEDYSYMEHSPQVKTIVLRNNR